MPQQLIYTSAPQGLVAGRSGYCTVACSEGLREALQLSLEQISYYEHSAERDAAPPVVCASRVIDIRGTRYQVLSRIADAGLDFTKRTNFIAHHLVFDPQEAAQLPAPPVILRHWNGWRNEWAGEPQVLRRENWGNLFSVAEHKYNPARNWCELTGDAVNAAALLENRAPESYLADGLAPDRVLPLLAESLALLAVRSAPSGAWQHTFTTCLQERDDLAAFRWRLVYSGSAAHQRLVARGASLKLLSGLRCGKIDDATADYARSGPQPLQIRVQPADQVLTEGEPLHLKVEARGVPPPAQYQWFVSTKEGRRTAVPGAVGTELRLAMVPQGVNRYLVVVSDGRGATVESRVAKVQVDRSRAAGPGGPPTIIRPPAKTALARPDEDELKVKPKGARAWVAADTAADEAWKKAEAVEKEKSKAAMWVWGGVIAFLIVFCALGYALYHVLSADAPGVPVNPAVASAPGRTPASTATVATNPIAPLIPRPTTNSPAPAAPNPIPAAPAMVAPANPRIALVSLDGVGGVDSAVIVQGEKQLKDAEDNLTSAGNELNEARKGATPDPDNIDSLHKKISSLNIESRRLAKEVESLQAAYKRQMDAANEEIQAKLQSAFPCPTNGPVFYQTINLQSSKTNAPAPVAASFEVPSDQPAVSLKAATSGVFDLDIIAIKDKRLSGPVLIVFSTNAVPISEPMAELVLWPANEPIYAACDARGQLNLKMNAGCRQILSDLCQTGGYDVQLRVRYLDGLDRQVCATNFSMARPGDYIFGSFADQLAAWKQEHDTVTNFLALAGERNSIGTFTNVWDDIDDIFQNLTKHTVAFDFKSDPGPASRSVLAAADYAPQRDQVKALIKASLGNDRLEDIATFVGEEGAAMDLVTAKERLEHLLQYGPPDNRKLEGIITVQSGTQPLGALHFISTAK